MRDGIGVALIFDTTLPVIMDSGLIRAASKWLRHFARECPGMTEKAGHLWRDDALVQ
ncbi:hypothetical protein BRAO375_3470020 [Bradyrhizobium sp. ORS 375]|nr:hypothetical protein BRAO375_3470020 [Bradyrhizobium sp. ORS 375]